MCYWWFPLICRHLFVAFVENQSSRKGLRQILSHPVLTLKIASRFRQFSHRQLILTHPVLTSKIELSSRQFSPENWVYPLKPSISETKSKCSRRPSRPASGVRALMYDSDELLVIPLDFSGLKMNYGSQSSRYMSAAASITPSPHFEDCIEIPTIL